MPQETIFRPRSMFTSSGTGRRLEPHRGPRNLAPWPFAAVPNLYQVRRYQTPYGGPVPNL